MSKKGSRLKVVPRTRKEKIEFCHEWLDRIDKGDYTKEERLLIRESEQRSEDKLYLTRYVRKIGNFVGDKIKRLS